MKKSIIRCIFVSAVLGGTITFLGTVRSSSSFTIEYRAEDIEAYGLEKTRERGEMKKTEMRGLQSLSLTLRSPSFWRVWCRDTLNLFFSILAGTLALTIWNKKETANHRFHSIAGSARSE